MEIANKYIDGRNAFNGLQFVNDARGKFRNNLKLIGSGGMVATSTIHLEWNFFRVVR